MKSIEVNWIRNVDKSLVIPEVVFSSLNWAGGMYHHPEKNEICIDGKYYDLKYGLIEVSVQFKSLSTESTLAHEWRHHWQAYHGWVNDYRFLWPSTFEEDDYDDLILKYFTLNNHEMDALRFQNKYSSVYDNWVEILYQHLQ